MRFRTALISTAVLACVLSAILAACGGGDDGSKETANGTPSSSTPEAPGTSTGGGGASGSNVTLTISDSSAAVGQRTDIELKALGIGEPGLGAYTVDVSYDNDILSATSCNGTGGTPAPGAATNTPSASSGGLSFCNPNYDSDKVRSVGAIAQGAAGDVPLATITFTCKKAGASDLTISVETLADATVGNPTDINHNEENGTITCS